ncbi:MAG: SDR family oxidoreductase [Vulcanimicrobiaceae bacterium]
MQHAVVVTGASTGIGAATSELLAQKGFVVYAGVRTDADAQRLASAHANLRPLWLDVTNPATVVAAAQRMHDDGVSLAGLVNNAGIAVGGPLEFLPVDELRKQFDVNLFGAIAVTQAFLPQLRATRGRVVFVGSISGRLAVPFIAPYSASKFALRAIADAMRMELSSAGITVALVEPGSVKTPIWRKGRDSKDDLVRRLPPEAATHYPGVVDALMRQTEREERSGMPAERVSEAILHALTSRKPRAYYLLGMPARLGSIISLLPAGFRDRLMLASMRSNK